jgi:trk system potassium uptake protein TrkA
MAAEGLVVTVIDQDEGALSVLPADTNALRIVGDPLAGDLIDRANVREADVLVAATPKDELNIVIGLIARKVYQIKHVVARVRDPKRSDLFAELGVGTICPTTLEAALIADHVESMRHPGELRIVIVGCGELGCHVANLLSRTGHNVVAVDRDRLSFEHLGEAFPGIRIEGDAADPSVLERAQAKDADLLIVATRNDNVNLTVTLVAKKILRLKDVIVRVQDPRREALFPGMGTLSSTIISANAALALIGRRDVTEPSP